MTRQYLRPDLRSGMIQNLDSDFSFVKTASFTTAAALCDAMGLSSVTNPPISLYNFVAAALPIINQLAAPTADIDTAVGTGPGGFNVVLPPPLTDVGTLWTSLSASNARCSAVAENDIGAVSMALLEVGYLNVNIIAAQSAITKKSGTGVAVGGYGVYTLTGSITCKVTYSDTVTQITISNGTAYPPGWYSLLTVFDRATGFASLYTSFGPPVRASIAGFGSLTSTTQFRPSGLPSQNQGRTTCAQAVWSGVAAEGIVGGNLDALNQFLNIPVV